MKAVVLRQTDDLAVLDVPVPEIGPGQALVRMTHCGICGSDIRYLHGDNPWAKQTLGEKYENPVNIILGHEVSGVVERVGDGCDAALVGRRVALLAFGTCGECFFCKRGEEHLCPNTQHLGHGAGWGESEYYYGGMAEYVPVPADWLVPLPDGVTNEAAAVLDPLGVAVHAVKKSAIIEGDAVMIIGGGAVGALAVQVAKARGAGEVVVVDINDAVLKVAAQMGADRTVNPNKESTAVLAEEIGGVGPRAIIDTIGARLDTYLPLLSRGGRYVMLTVTENAQDFRTILLAGERSIVSSCNFRFEDYWEALSLLETGQIIPGPIITHTYALADALDGFRVAEDKEHTGAVKVVMSNLD